MTDIEDAASCTRCPVGTIAPDAGAAACRRCEGEGATSTDGKTCRVCPNNVCGEDEQFMPTPAPTEPFSCLRSSGDEAPQSVECGAGEIYCFVIESGSNTDDARVNERKCVADFSECKSGPPGLDAQKVADELATSVKWSCCVVADCNTDVAASNALNKRIDAGENPDRNKPAGQGTGEGHQGASGPSPGNSAQKVAMSIALLGATTIAVVFLSS